MYPFSALLQQQNEQVNQQFSEQAAHLLPLSEMEQQFFSFSEFACNQVLAHPIFLASLRASPPKADEWQYYDSWLRENAGCERRKSINARFTSFSSANTDPYCVDADVSSMSDTN